MLAVIGQLGLLWFWFYDGHWRTAVRQQTNHENKRSAGNARGLYFFKCHCLEQVNVIKVIRSKRKL